MATYIVEVEIVREITIEVEAENEDDAAGLAFEEVTTEYPDYDVDIVDTFEVEEEN